MVSMSEQPDRDRAAADGRLLAVALHAVEAPAPPSLHRSVAALHAARAPRRRMVPAFALACAAIAAAAVALMLSAGVAAPTVARAAVAALAPATGAAPASLRATGTTIVFPDWSMRGWPTAGARHDRIGGRMVTTELYRSYGLGTIGYSIVSGGPLRWGASGSTWVRAGERYGLISAHRETIVTWVQSGHTCILASRTANATVMLALAAQERTAAA